MTLAKPKRGEVWYIQLDPTRGREQAKTRPCIVLSINAFNKGSSQLVIIVPLTTKFGGRFDFISIVPPEGGVSQVSYALCEQLRTVSIERLTGESLGLVHADTLVNIEFRIKALLGFD